MFRRALHLGLIVLSPLSISCVNPQPTGSPILMDPTTTQRASGASDDVLEVSQLMLSSMRRDDDVEKRPVPRLIFLEEEEIRVDPKLRDYNARILYNQFTANLNRVAGGDFKFINRKAVSRERERQLTGQVKTSGVEAAPAGADMVLTIELIALEGAASNTVQYTFRLTDLDGINLWTASHLIVKRI